MEYLYYEKLLKINKIIALSSILLLLLLFGCRVGQSPQEKISKIGSARRLNERLATVPSAQKIYSCILQALRSQRVKMKFFFPCEMFCMPFMAIKAPFLFNFVPFF